MICGVGRRCGLYLALLWLWGRSAAAALIPPLAREFPYAEGAALKEKKIGAPVMAQWKQIRLGTMRLWV